MNLLSTIQSSESLLHVIGAVIFTSIVLGIYYVTLVHPYHSKGKILQESGSKKNKSKAKKQAPEAVKKSDAEVKKEPIKKPSHPTKTVAKKVAKAATQAKDISDPKANDKIKNQSVKSTKNIQGKEKASGKKKPESHSKSEIVGSPNNQGSAGKEKKKKNEDRSKNAGGWQEVKSNKRNRKANVAP